MQGISLPAEEMLVSQDEHCSGKFVSYGLNKIILNNLEAPQWHFFHIICHDYI